MREKYRPYWWLITGPVFRFVAPSPCVRLGAEVLAKRIPVGRFLWASVLMHLRLRGWFVTQSVRFIGDQKDMMIWAFASLHSSRELLDKAREL